MLKRVRRGHSLTVVALKSQQTRVRKQAFSPFFSILAFTAAPGRVVPVPVPSIRRADCERVTPGSACSEVKGANGTVRGQGGGRLVRRRDRRNRFWEWPRGACGGGRCRGR